jgi:hypothetical protein
MLVTILFISTNAFAIKNLDTSTIQEEEESIETSIDYNKYKKNTGNENDLDPNADLSITVTINEVRAFDKIDLFSDPDFYVKIYVNDMEYISSIQRNQKYVYNPGWTATFNVDDFEEFVDIKIQLWDWNPLIDEICDISKNFPDDTYIEQYDVDLTYSLKTGHWVGEDYVRSKPRFADMSGYGRLNGCDDNTIYKRDKDCELWFTITQDDYDGDNIPYWSEVYVYGTDPQVNDIGLDEDADGVPLEWEHKWGHYLSWNWYTQQYEHYWFYDPFVWDDHKNLDIDEDGLQNTEEYLTSEWGSDPFRKDIFMELDQMEKGPNGEGALVPEGTIDLLTDVYSKHDIVLHIDDGCMGGGQLIPFDINTSGREMDEIYLNYFLNNDPDNWRRGVFHYGLIIYRSDFHPGFVFSSTNDGENWTLDSFCISTKWHETLPMKDPIWDIILRRSFDSETHREIIYATAIMHETGHNLGLFGNNPPGVDADTGFGNILLWFRYKNYRSCMNYGYIYYLVDYSDGSHGRNDFDDWGNIDLTLFEDPFPWIN